MSEESHTGWYFLLAVIGLYVGAAVFGPSVLMPALNFTVSIFSKIIPVIIMVFALLVGVNYLISPKMLVKYLGKGSGPKGWLIGVAAGIISTGPIYMWYPMLNELQKHGVRNGIIATFLYNRAVKPALIPLLIFYFGLEYTIVLTIVMIIISILQGIVVERGVEVIS